MEIRGINLRMLLEPLDFATDQKHEVKSALSEKTPSSRLRAVIFVQWKQLSAANKIENQPFDTFYAGIVNRMIEDIKSTLEPE